MLPLPYCFNVDLPLSWYICLPASAWAVYLTDHLIDSFRNTQLNTPRHQFIRQYKTNIVLLIAILLLITSYVLFKWPDFRLIITGLTTGLFALVYLALAWSHQQKGFYWYNKELFVAITYATGIYLATGLSQSIQPMWLLLYFLFIMVVYTNLLTISIIEYNQEQGYSWVKLIGRNRSEKLLYGIIVCISLISGSVAYLTENKPYRYLLTVYALISFFHFMIYHKRESLMKNEWYRKAGELLFLLPIVVWLLIKG